MRVKLLCWILDDKKRQRILRVIYCWVTVSFFFPFCPTHVLSPSGPSPATLPAGLVPLMCSTYLGTIASWPSGFRQTLLRLVLLFGVKRSRHRRFKGPMTKYLRSPSATARSWFGSVGRSNAWYSPMPFPSVSEYAFTNTPALAMTLRLVIPNHSYIFFVFIELHMATLERKSRTFLPESAQLWTGRSDPIKLPPSSHFLTRVLSQRRS